MEYYLPLKDFRDEDFQVFSKLPHSSERSMHYRPYERVIPYHRKKA
jgi:hypothetical protein